MNLVRRSLWDRVDRDHRQSEGEFRRRQRVTTAVTVVGAATLAWSLNIAPGSAWFYVATFTLAAVWAAGAFLSGPLHLGRIGPGPAPRRPVLAPVAVGAVLAGVFVVGALVVREVDVLAGPVDDVLAYFREGSGALVLLVAGLNGVAEELFFRGALYASIPGRHQVLATSAVYTVATIATGNVMLGFSAAILGVVTGLERRASGGVLSPILTHVTWSAILLLVLPQLF